LPTPMIATLTFLPVAIPSSLPRAGVIR